MGELQVILDGLLDEGNGQAEIYGGPKVPHLCGQIHNIFLTGVDQLTIVFEWLAQEQSGRWYDITGSGSPSLVYNLKEAGGFTRTEVTYCFTTGGDKSVKITLSLAPIVQREQVETAVVGLS